MSATAQSLGSIIEANTSGGGGEAAAPSVGVPSLGQIINANAGGMPAPAPVQQVQPVTSAPAGQIVNPAVQTTVQPAAQGTQPVQVQAPEQTQATAQQQAVLRHLLSQRNFNVPETAQTDDQIADLIAAELDAAAEATRLTESAEFQAFAQNRDQFLAWLNSQAQSPQNTQNSQQNPSATSPASAANVAQIPDAALTSAIANGYVMMDPQTQKWSARFAQFSAHADAMNARAAKAAEMKAALAADPDAFIQAKVTEALATKTVGQESTELKQLLEELRAERQATQQSQVNQWIEANRTRLYDQSGQFTPYAKLYQQFEEVISSAAPNISPLERHNKVLEKLNAAQAAFQSTLPAQGTVPAPQPVQQQSFLSGAARRNGTNRLSEYQGAASNQVKPQVPVGKGGHPSLAGLIQQMTAISGPGN